MTLCMFCLTYSVRTWTKPVDFFCRCSRKRFLGVDHAKSEDLEDLKDDVQEIVCHFCNNKEYISAEEIRGLITKAKAQRN